MMEIHSYMSEVFESETTKSLRAAGFVFVDVSDEEIEYSVNLNF